jgi:uncharacterized membrane protein
MLAPLRHGSHRQSSRDNAVFRQPLGAGRRKHDPMTARSQKRRISFAAILRTAAALSSRASGQDVASAKLREDWIDEAERRM